MKQEKFGTTWGQLEVDTFQFEEDYNVRQMSYRPTTDPRFLGALEEWLRSSHELFLMVRYSHACGGKSYEYFSAFLALAERLRQLPPRTCVIAFHQPQLPIRGVVDDKLIDACLAAIPNGSEYLLVETIRRTLGGTSWFRDRSGETHEELREDLEDSRGFPVAVGLYPPWLEDNDEVISAVVPDEHGVVRVGIY